MIEACICVGDLKGAGDFLMKMEAAGFCPDAELLDKVMDLYSQNKATREKAPTGDREALEALEAAMEEPRGRSNRFKMSGDAPEFKPAPKQELSGDAPEFEPEDALVGGRAGGGFNFDA